MKLLLSGAALFLCTTAVAEFVPERFPMPMSGKVSLGKDFLVTSDLIALGASEASADSSSFDIGSLYLRDRGTTGTNFQRLAETAPSGDYAASIALRDGILIVKHSAKTLFYRKENDQWVADGIIDASSRFLTAVGPVAVNSKFLISGMEVYSWPRREYIQTLTPPNYTGAHTLVDVSLLENSPAVFSYTDSSVWNYVQEANRFSTNALPIAPPDDHAEGSFGVRILLTPPQGLFLLVSAPGDSEHAKRAGAVHLYYRGSPGEWNHIQKITAPSPMAGDHFGAGMAADHSREYIAAPYRNETLQKSGAIFVYQVPDTGLPLIRREFREKITLKETVDHANLGTTLAVHNEIIYASVNGTAVAFHPAMILTPNLTHNSTFLVNAGLRARAGDLEAASNPAGSWSTFPAGHYSTGFQFPFETESNVRFFRVKLRSAFH